VIQKKLAIYLMDIPFQIQEIQLRRNSTLSSSGDAILDFSIFFSISIVLDYQNQEITSLISDKF
jgi:hypothetical protein